MYKCAKCESCFEGEMDPASVDRCITYEGCYRYENLAVDGTCRRGPRAPHRPSTDRSTGRLRAFQARSSSAASRSL